MNFFLHDSSGNNREKLELPEDVREIILDFQMLDWFWFEEHPGATVRHRQATQVEIDLLGFAPDAVVTVTFDGQKISTTNKPVGI